MKVGSIRLLLFLAVFLVTPLTAFGDNKVVRLGSTTSVKASGLLSAMKPRFEKDTGYKLQAFATGSGRAMNLARKGQFDILIVHAPASEKALIAEGFAEKRIPIMKNFFLIVGPAEDPAGIKGLNDAREAFRRIANSRSKYVSRADDSGTHKKELALWKAAGIEPIGAWYYESGLGMGQALAQANEQSAYIMVDDGTWLAKKDSLKLVSLTRDENHLDNTYSIVLLSNRKLKNLNRKAANVFADWIISPAGKRTIRGMAINGAPMFTLVK